MIEAERWRRVKEIFDSAVSCRIEDRSALVRDLCGDDRVLQGEVESLLAADAGHGSLSSNTWLVARCADLCSMLSRALSTIRRTRSRRATTSEPTRSPDCSGPAAWASLSSPRHDAWPRRRRQDPARPVARRSRPARPLRPRGAPPGLAQPPQHWRHLWRPRERRFDTRGLAVKALVLELVEGETLADRIARSGAVPRTAGATGQGLYVGEAGPGLPIDEVMSIASQVIEALEAAHERGIVHRDLKPANIKITPEGRVKVLDFGLARAVGGIGGGPRLANSPTVAVCDTQDGVLLGTAPYMSPEQARGRLVDKRTDIWAFGCVVYEMLTRRARARGRRRRRGARQRNQVGTRLECAPGGYTATCGCPCGVVCRRTCDSASTISPTCASRWRAPSSCRQATAPGTAADHLMRASLTLAGRSLSWR